MCVGWSVCLCMCAVDQVVPVILFLLTGMNTLLGWECGEPRPGREESGREGEKERQERRSTSDTTYLSPRTPSVHCQERERERKWGEMRRMKTATARATEEERATKKQTRNWICISTLRPVFMLVLFSTVHASPHNPFSLPPARP